MRWAPIPIAWVAEEQALATAEDAQLVAFNIELEEDHVLDSAFPAHVV